MIKKLLMIIPVLFILAPAAEAVEISPEGTVSRKLQRGFLNIALSPIEVSHHMMDEQKRDQVEPGWLFGMFRGILSMAGRSLAGAYEIVTFPIPYPANYGPLFYPEFAWQHLESQAD